MPKFVLPSGLREFAENKHQVNVEARNLTDALNELGKKYPALKATLVSNSFKSAPFVSMFVDSEQIEDESFGSTFLEPETEIYVVLAVAGG